MGKGIRLIIIVAAFVLLLGGAYMLYAKLGDEYGSNQLSTESGIETDGNKEEESTEEEKLMAPDFTVYDEDGNAAKLSDYFGKPIVLNFWASWCGPCRSEMPEFNEKAKELEGEVTFLMVNVTTSSQETFEKASSYIEEEGFTFPVFYDTSGEAGNTYGAYSLPTSYFIDQDGYLIARATGAIDGETLAEAIGTIYDEAE